MKILMVKVGLTKLKMYSPVIDNNTVAEGDRSFPLSGIEFPPCVFSINDVVASEELLMRSVRGSTMNNTHKIFGNDYS